MKYIIANLQKKTKTQLIKIILQYQDEKIKNKQKISKYQKEYFLKNKEKITEKDKKFHKNFPWKRILRNINIRCNNKKSKEYKWYGKKGIENHLTEKDIKFLMERDNYYELKNPTIDREDNDGDYELSNCRFIENTENAAKDKRKPVLQYDIQGNFIKEWISMKQIEHSLHIAHSSISLCCSGKRNFAGGYKWKYKG